jgi:hypothetical protein
VTSRWFSLCDLRTSFLTALALASLCDGTNHSKANLAQRYRMERRFCTPPAAKSAALAGGMRGDYQTPKESSWSPAWGLVSRCLSKEAAFARAEAHSLPVATVDDVCLHWSYLGHTPVATAVFEARKVPSVCVEPFSTVETSHVVIGALAESPVHSKKSRRSASYHVVAPLSYTRPRTHGPIAPSSCAHLRGGSSILHIFLMHHFRLSPFCQTRASMTPVTGVCDIVSNIQLDEEGLGPSSSHPPRVLPNPLILRICLSANIVQLLCSVVSVSSKGHCHSFPSFSGSEVPISGNTTRCCSGGGTMNYGCIV